MKFKYINTYTGEVYTSLFHFLRTVISDVIHYKKCRTIKILKIEKLGGY